MLDFYVYMCIIIINLGKGLIILIYFIFRKEVDFYEKTIR